MKKMFLSFIVMVSLLMTGCVGLEYINYPTLKYNKDNPIYNGKKYEYIVTYKVQELNLIPVYDRQIIIAKTTYLLEYFPVYFSNRDIQKEWMITCYGAEGIHHIKEGVSLPDGNTLTYSEVYFTLQGVQEGGVQIDSTNPRINLFGAKLTDIIEMDNGYYDLEAEQVGYSFFISQEFPYIAWGNATILMLHKDEVYIFNGGGTGKYYRIKDEYQEAFKTAITQLNAMQPQ